MKKYSNGLIHVSSACLCLLLFFGVLWSEGLAVAGFFLRYDMIILAALITVAFVIMSRLRKFSSFWGLAYLSSCLCALILSGVWGSKVSDLSVMAGTFPVSDARAYLNGILSLTHSGELSEFASRRPIAPALSGLLLYVFNGNVLLCIASLVFLVSLALAWATDAIVRSHGYVAGCIFYYGTFLFYRRFIGTILTEHIGLLFGCLAFVLLWRSAHRGDKALCAGGQAILSIALCARAGAFFVLPAIALWGGARWKGAKRFSISVCLAVVLAGLVGFLINAVLARTIGTAERSFGNYSYVLYGLVNGGDWTLVRDEHPEIANMLESERNSFIYDQSFKSIRERPAALLAGGLRAVGGMLFSYNGLYSFVLFANQRSIREWCGDNPAPDRSLLASVRSDPYKYLNIAATYGIFFFLLLAAACGCVAMRKTSQAGLLSAAGLGVLASSAFAPPWDSDLMRVYAATLPFMLAFPAIGASHILRKLFTFPEFTPSVSLWQEKQSSVLWVSTLSVVCICLIPILFCLCAEPSPASQEDGHCGEKGFVFLPGSTVRLSEPAAGSGQWASLSSAELIHRHRGVLSASRQDYTDDLVAAMQTGDLLAMAYDCDAGFLRFVVCRGDISDGELFLLPSQKHGLWWGLRQPEEGD